MRFLLDSVILIDHFNGVEPATAFLREQGGECALSAVTRAEVLTGFDAETETLALELLDLFPTLPLTAESADTAALLRRTQRLKLPDSLQAAIALHNNLTLVTRNTRDFRSHGDMKVLIPYRLSSG